MAHRYETGQLVELRPIPRTTVRQSGLCEIVFRMPRETGPYRYRVKSLSENFERVVSEDDLFPRQQAEDDAV